MSAIPDDMFTPDVIADPYAYYGRIATKTRSIGTSLMHCGW